MIEAKADTIVNKVHIFGRDGSGNSSGWLDTMHLTTTYQTFILDLTDGGSSLDVTDVAFLKFNQPGTSISAANDNLYIKHLAIGDTTQPITLINDNEAEDVNLVCYPNPVMDKLNVSGIENIIGATVHDLTGKVLMIADAKEVYKGIDVSGLTAGLYIVRFKTTDGTIIEQLIKE